MKCRRFSGGGCGSAEKPKVRTYLNKVYHDFVSKFRKPDLRCTLPGRKVDGEQGRYYIYVIRKEGKGIPCSDANGMYLSGSNTGVTCYDGSGDPSENTTRMEFFHAIQYNYAPVSWNKKPDNRPPWILEGTASFVENPKSNADTAIRDGSRPLRKINIPLTKESDNNPDYKVQDFWVDLINSRNATPAKILNPIFERQQNAVSNVNRVKVDMLYSLADDHWEWVRNQAFESKVISGNNALNGKCRFNPKAYKGSVSSFSYDAPSLSGAMSNSVTVDELTAKVVKVKIQNKSGSEEILANITANTFAPKGYAKVFKKPSTPPSDCINRGNSSDSANYDINVPKGGNRERFTY